MKTQKEKIQDLLRTQSFRTAKTEAKYQKELQSLKGCFICRRDLLIKEYKHWIIVGNRYPYDAVAQTHHMIAPKRHISKHEELSLEELSELNQIREKNADTYDFEMFNLPHRQTHPPHFHIHLIKYK